MFGNSLLNMQDAAVITAFLKKLQNIAKKLTLNIMKNMKIHENLTEAKEAITKYVEKIQELQEEFGVFEECDDSCSSVCVVVKYRDENGNIREHWV